jgi:hypothetical protein
MRRRTCRRLHDFTAGALIGASLVVLLVEAVLRASQAHLS